MPQLLASVCKVKDLAKLGLPRMGLLHCAFLRVINAVLRIGVQEVRVNAALRVRSV